jgi:hypothetical protein
MTLYLCASQNYNREKNYGCEYDNYVRDYPLSVTYMKYHGVSGDDFIPVFKKLFVTSQTTFKSYFKMSCYGFHETKGI